MTEESLPKQLPRLWRHIEPRRRMQFAVLVALMLAASLAEIVSIGAVVPFLGILTTPHIVFQHELMQPLIRALNLAEPKDLVLPLSAGFAVAAVVAGVMRMTLLYVQTRLSYLIGSDLDLGIYRRTLYQPYLFHTQRNSSEIIAAVTNKTVAVAHYIVLPILSIISSALLLIGILTALIVVQPQIAFATMLGAGSIYGLFVILTRKRLAFDGQRVAREQDRVIKSVQEGLGGIRDVLIEGTQELYSRIFYGADLPMRRSQANIYIIGGGTRFVIEALGMVLIAIVAYWLASTPEGLLASASALGALALGAQRMLPIMQLCFTSWSNLRGGRAALSDVLDLLDQRLPPDAGQLPPPPMPFERAIALNGLSFRYSVDARWVLRDINLVIPKGSRFGFIGATGSGKSTFLDVVMGLLPPTEGTLEIDGASVTPANCRAWQAHLAHVPQSIFLADGTIAENIAFGLARDRIDLDRVGRAARAAQVADVIEGWDEQYDTVVGERGVRLSGGQRQRIGIARALYKAADVIILDEATSALDTATEEAVMRAIESLGEGITVLIVAHRLTTLRTCTQIIELCDGRVGRIGTYKDIVEVAAMTQSEQLQDTMERR